MILHFNEAVVNFRRNMRVMQNDRTSGIDDRVTRLERHPKLRAA